MRSQIVVRMEFMATHRWPDAPQHRAYLSYFHAHVFKFEGRAPVSHADRQIEFHDLRTLLYEAVAKIANYHLNGPATFGDLSCEQIGEKILETVPSLSSVVVSEDGYFDAEVFQETRLPGKRVYLASSSRGDKSKLVILANELARRGYFVFAPCLGFVGQETSQIRPLLLDIGISTLRKWATILIYYDEGIPSEGAEAEIEDARSNDIPTTTIRSIDDLRLE